MPRLEPVWPVGVEVRCRYSDADGFVLAREDGWACPCPCQVRELPRYGVRWSNGAWEWVSELDLWVVHAGGGL